MTDYSNNVYQELEMSLEDKVLLFQAVLDQSYNSVVITDASNSGDGPSIIYANPAFENMTGYSVKELKGKSPKILQGPLTDRAVIEEMRICIRAGKYFEGSAINYNKEGQPYHVEWNISPIKDKSGIVQYFVSVQKNITAYIKAEHERTLLTKALNDSPDCVIITDIENKIVFVNAGFQQLTGYKQNEVLGKKPSFLWGSPLDVVSESSESYLSQKSMHFKLHEPNLSKDGSLFYVDQSIVHIEDDAGNTTHYVSFSKDATDRLKRELALKDMASRDSLTGQLNRRAGEQLLKQYDEVKHLPKRALCLIMMDIDNFKKINDTYGHVFGDKILKTSSQLINSKVRSTDSLIRWGGEEFLIIVTDSKLDEAMELAERMRRSIEQHIDKDVGRITASFGVAELQAYESTANLINRADKALYKAKLSGKNCVNFSK